MVCRPQLSPGISAGDWLEQLSDELLQAGALSVTLEDAGDDTLDEARAVFGEPGSDPAIQGWPESSVSVLLSADDDPLSWWRGIESAKALPSPAVLWIDDQDWVTKTQAQFRPIEIADCLWIGPSWHETPDRYRQPTRRALTIDPGMAFGTGGHATTQLCLEALVRAFHQMPTDQRMQVIDYGCGSGILALAAVSLGAQSAIGVDIDPQAVVVARSNADQNGLAHKAFFFTAEDDLSAAGQVPDGGFDLVIANILAQPLKVLAPVLWRLTAPHGGLVLSGLLESQEEMLCQWFAQSAPERPFLGVLGRREGWSCLGFLPH